ncbi:MAG: PAS domain S-box protein [Anaerolineae bacterium]|nr:PAS domain S-box protein [Anaerolineae bacterium]
MTTHRLLMRQLRKLGLDENSPPSVAAWQQLIRRVSRAYTDAEQDRYLLERSLEISSAEMQELYDQLRRASETQLVAERDKLQAVITSLGEGLCALDAVGCLLFMNPVAEMLLGWTEREVVGRPLLELIRRQTEGEPPEGQPLALDNELLLARLRSGHPYRNDDGRLWRKDGSTFPVACLFNPIMTDGIFQGVVLAFQDITGRKQAELALQQMALSLAQQNQTLEALNQLAREVTATLDLGPILVTAVKSATHILNVTSAYITLWDETGRKLIVVAEYYGPEASPLEHVSDLGTVYDVEADLGDPPELLQANTNIQVTQVDNPALTDEERRHLQQYDGKTVLEVPLHAKGRAIGYLDLWESRRKREYSQDEINLVQAIAHQVALAIDNARLYEQATEANRLKTEFLAKVSHELRTPLSVILGYVEMLQEGVYGQMVPPQQDVTRRIIENTGLLTRLVSDLLDAARLEAGKLTLKSEPFLIRDVVGRIQAQMTIMAQRKQLAFYTTIEDDVPATIMGDSDRIEQMLINLITNAIKYTEQGHISLCVCRPETNFWALTITDTGVGIAAEAQSRIFEAFRQVDDSVTRRHSGAGLGLSIVRQLARLMGGEVHLESEAGKGSTFTILLPLTTTTQER